MQKQTNSEFENQLSKQNEFDLQESKESSDQQNSNEEEEEENDEEEEDDIINIDEIEEDKPPEEINNMLETAKNPETMMNTLQENIQYNTDDLRLETLDLNIVSKEDAVNFLLYKTKFDKSNKSLSPRTKRKRNKNRYTKVKSMVNKESFKPNYFLNTDTNPEKTYDFNTALTRVVASKMNDKTVNVKLKKALISKRKVKNIKTVNYFIS